MALNRAFVQNSATTPLDTRLMWMTNIQKNPDNSPRLGQLYGGINPVAATASMNVTLIDGVTFVTSRTANDGVCVLVNVGDLALTLDQAPTANARYDVVWVKQDDNTNGDADSLPVLGKTTGTAAANPQLANTLANVPTGALPLASIYVPANVTSTSASGVIITILVQSTALAQTPIRYRSKAAMDADAANVIEGALGYVKGQMLCYLLGGIWKRIDQDVFTLITNTGTPAATGTTINTLGGSPATAVTSDPNFFPTRTDQVIGPLPVGGYYEVAAAVTWVNNSTGERYISIAQTDTELSPAIADRRAASGGSQQTIGGIAYFNAGDYIKLKGWQSSGGTLNYNSRLSARLVRVP